MAYCTVDEVAAFVRIRATAENTPGLQRCIDAAAAEIDHEIDPVYEAGTVPVVAYLFSAATAAADPGPGYVRLDKTSPVATSHLYFDAVDADGVDWAAGLADAASGDVVQLEDATGSSWEEFTLTGPAVDNAGWFDLPVAHSGAGGDALALDEGALLTVVFLRAAALSAQEQALVNRVNIVRAAEWFKGNDAMFGVVGFDQTGALQAPRDGFNRHAYELTPAKQQWGIA
jgi:hypothetical protein